MRRSRLESLYVKAVERLSFSGELYKLRRDLNARIDQPESMEDEPRARDAGLARWFKRRRISIAEAYLRVVRDLDSHRSQQRLRALRTMVEASFHTQALDMPLNTARVQLALIKEAVKSRDDHRRQLEMLHDFSLSSTGNARTIRRLLNMHGLMEVPETGKPLGHLDAGWDGHVHDTATSGRKNPTQLLIDAFIKGISSIRIAYNGPSAVGQMEEALKAGRILGIRVDAGLEIGLQFEGERYHFMALLPEMHRREEVRRLFEDGDRNLDPIFAGLKADQESRVESLRRVISAFNEKELGRLNDGFPDKRPYKVPKLRLKDLAAMVPLQNASRTHLGELLWRHYRPVLFNRVLLLKSLRAKALHDAEKGIVEREDLEAAEARYTRVREEYRTLSPDSIRERFFPEPSGLYHSSSFDDLGKLVKTLRKAGCSLKLLHPLEHGLARATRLIESGRGLIAEIEVYNIRDSLHRDTDEIARLCEIVEDCNERSAADGTRPYKPVCGSESTGRSPGIPGMGFVRSGFLPRRGLKGFMRHHVILPPPVSRLILSGSSRMDPSARRSHPEIVCLGKVSEGYENRIGDEEDAVSRIVPPARALRYLNPSLVRMVISAIGFLVAASFIGPGYAALWLGITGFRNSLADLLAFRGTSVRAWSHRNVNWENVAQSLFWTGFSVPIMSFIKARFDLLWPLEATGLLYNAVKFFFISFSNGLYIASHNTARGFDGRVVRMNFFRSVISWPFATAFAPVGNAIGIPSIVQAKIWSDVVAGFIEGGSKYFNTLRLRKRDAEGIIPRVLGSRKAERAIAVYDLLYLFRTEPRARVSLAGILWRNHDASPSSAEPLVEILMDPRLDRRLVDYAVTHYENEMAVDLVKLASVTLPEMRDWLDKRGETGILKAL